MTADHYSLLAALIFALVAVLRIGRAVAGLRVTIGRQRRDAPLAWTRRWRRACRGCEQPQAYMADLSLRFPASPSAKFWRQRRDDAVRIKAGWWVALSVGLLLVAGLAVCRA